MSAPEPFPPASLVATLRRDGTSEVLTTRGHPARPGDGRRPL